MEQDSGASFFTIGNFIGTRSICICRYLTGIHKHYIKYEQVKDETTVVYVYMSIFLRWEQGTTPPPLPPSDAHRGRSHLLPPRSFLPE